jgi:pyruvate dehydrogenase E2 component (dihydrolipoamide acetyltransferase)
VPGDIISAGSSDVDLDGPMASPAIRREAHELDVSLEGVKGSGEHGRITLDDVRGVAQGGAAPAGGSDRVRISPYARRIAMERGVDVSQIRGTGPGGAIQASDVLSVEAAEPRKPVSAVERMQRAIAAAMTRANDEIPHYYVEHSIDMGNALAWLRETNASLSVSERLVSGVLVLRAVARALRKHKKLNATWQGGEALPSDGIHVGLAVSLRGGGLVAPALRNTDEGSLSDLMARMTDLVSRARAGALRSSEMTSATITLTSLGERGVESVTPIIFPPQVAIVGCGATLERPWVVDGRVLPRPIMRVTLGADHRVSSGHQGARFLSVLEGLLQEPEKL